MTFASIPSFAAAASRADRNADLEGQVRDYFADVPIMAEIARCESDFTQYGKSGQPLHGGTGTMIGLFQISEILHREVAETFGWDIDTPEGNMAYARYLYEKNGIRPWLASKHCWNATATAMRTKAAALTAATQTKISAPATTAASTATTTLLDDDASTLEGLHVQLKNLLARVMEMQQTSQQIASVQ